VRTLENIVFKPFSFERLQHIYRKVQKNTRKERRGRTIGFNDRYWSLIDKR